MKTHDGQPYTPTPPPKTAVPWDYLCFPLSMPIASDRPNQKDFQVVERQCQAHSRGVVTALDLSLLNV